MPAIVDCPACNRKLRIPDALLGKPVKCPTCGNMFSESAPPPPEMPALEPQPPAPSQTTRPCPACGEQVGMEPGQCPFCEEPLGAPPRPLAPYEEQHEWEQPVKRRRRDEEDHRGTLILVLGILSIVIGAALSCPCYIIAFVTAAIGLGLGLPAVVMGRTDLQRMKRYEMDPSGHGITQAGMICGIVGASISALILMLYVAIVILLVVSGG